MKIQIITSTDPLLAEVMALGKKNAKTLGMFPEGAFIDHAKKRNIFGAIEDGKIIGYLLFRVTQSKGIISIAHLCVDPTYRQKGIAKALLDELKKKYKNLLKGIMLSCRKDYVEASKFYEKNEFKAVKDIRSRSQEENYLVKWYYDFGNNDLFSETHLYSDKVNVLLDANIIIKLREEETVDNAETHALNADWLKDEVDFFFAPETYNEINRDTDRARSLATRQFLTGFQEAKFDPTIRDKIYEELAQHLKGHTPNHLSDRKQVSECIAYGLNYFITNDQQILDAADDIFIKYNLRILRPAELILFIDELKNKSDYLSIRLSGANYEYKKIGQEDISSIVEEFVDTNLKKHELRTILTKVAADIKNSDVRLVKDSENKFLGFFAAFAQNGYLKVPAIKIQKNKLSAILFYRLIHDIIQLAISKGSNVIHIEEVALSDVMVTALQSFGFQEREGIWYKLALVGQHDTDSFLTSNALLTNHWNVQLVNKKLKSLTGNEKEEYKLGLERKLWPLKFNDIEIPTYIIPIRSLWAANLFDHYQASHNLFGAKAEIAWHRENIYYRSVKPVSEKTPARILWYTSTDAKNPIGREKGIVACSYLDEVHTDEAKPLYQKFKNYGVYEWDDIYESAGKDSAKVMKALKFSDTEVFQTPVSFEKISEVMVQNGKAANTFASPVQVTKEIFNQIYKIGKELQ